MRTRLSVALLLAAVATAPAARAQSDVPPSFSRAPAPVGASRFAFGLSFDVAQPVREFRSFVANGWGGSAHVLYRVDPAGAVALRADAGLLNYGSERSDVRVRGADDLYVQTSHNIFWAGVGPQVMIPAGPIRPYVNAQVGFAVFSTNSSLRRDEPFDDDDTIDSDNEHSDATTTWGAGGGLLVRLTRGVSLDLNARYHANGVVNYLREGMLTDATRDIVVPIRSRADLWTYRVGLSLGGW